LGLLYALALIIRSRVARKSPCGLELQLRHIDAARSTLLCAAPIAASSWFKAESQSLRKSAILYTNNRMKSRRDRATVIGGYDDDGKLE
jgi:hypothetical protein